jgi:alpha-glucosidase
MKKASNRLFSIILFCGVLTFAFGQQKQTASISSPDGKLKIIFKLNDQGVPFYAVERKGAPIIQDSKLGFIFKDGSLDKGFKISGKKELTFDETWIQPWGEVKNIRNHYKAITINLENREKKKLNITFKAYNDGIGFQYEIPVQALIKEFQITDELTEFNMASNADTWWIPAFGDEQDSEYLFKKNKLSDLKVSTLTPLTMQISDSLFVSIHEAALVNYAAMALAPKGGPQLKADLTPWADGTKVKSSAPMKTPWRTIQVAEKAGDLITSYLILNLNEPNKLGDVSSWVKPGKYNGIWWGMHIKTQTWESGPKHGATTQNVKQLIDFASQNNINGVLAEGWNLGWDGDWTKNTFNFTTPYPDYNMEELSKYATSKGVGLIAHHETACKVENYESQMEQAFDLLEKNNIHGLKTGYVGKRINGKEYHQGQYMVRHYQKVMEIAARHKVMIDVHEPIKDTGLRRTFPNMMTREGARGTEYEAWSEGNPPSHTTILPFTRCLGGPLDYTPGIFDLLIEGQNQFRVHTTLAKQLALYVVIYSPLQMVADLPEHYEGNPAFQFIKDVPTDWEDTKVLHASIGDYISIVRKERNGRDWFLGSITNEDGRNLETKLDFLTPGKKYKAEIYADSEQTHWQTSPFGVDITSREVDSNTILQIKLAPGGGQAIRFHQLD